MTNIFKCKSTFGIIHLHKLVRSEKGAEAYEYFHNDGSTNNNSKDDFLEEPFNHPGVDSLGIHKELSGDTELAEHVTEKFNSFKAIQLAVVPQLALRLSQGSPGTWERE